MGLASSKSVRQASRLQVQGRVDIAVLNPKSAGQVSKLEREAGFLHYSHESELLLLWETLVFVLKLFN